MWQLAHDTWHVKRDMWHVTCDTWHVTRDKWHMVGGENSQKNSAPQLLGLGIDSVLKILNKKITYIINQLIMKVFKEQPRLQQFC